MNTGAGYQGSENSEMARWRSKGGDREREWEWVYGERTASPDLVFRQPLDHLLQADRMETLGLMVGTVVHEVNNFLTGIMGAAQILEMSDTNASRQGYYKNILRMSQRIHDLLQGIKDFSRQSSQPYALTDIRVPIEAAISLVENLMPPHRIRLKRSFDRDLPPVRGNADQIEQVFLNLFQNAIHAMERGGVLTVSAEQEGEDVIVTVVDTGCGIPEEHMHRVFDVFFTTKPVGRGTGLGLAICRRIIREHRGRIGVESEVGVGTQFTVRLPAAMEERA